MVLLSLLLAAVTLAVYWPVRLNDFVNYDDGEYIINNPHLQHGLNWSGVAWAFRTGYAANWHPLTWLSHMLDVKLFGLHPAGHHLANLCFRIASTLPLFLRLARATTALWRSPLSYSPGLCQTARQTSHEYVRGLGYIPVEPPPIPDLPLSFGKALAAGHQPGNSGVNPRIMLETLRTTTRAVRLPRP